jgi:hypothetical protein
VTAGGGRQGSRAVDFMVFGIFSRSAGQETAGVQGLFHSFHEVNPARLQKTFLYAFSDFTFDFSSFWERLGGNYHGEAMR